MIPHKSSVPAIIKEKRPSFTPLYTSSFIPLYTYSVACGFPSPADDYLDQPLDLNEHLIIHPSATFFARASGHSMNGCGIYDKDLLIIDRSMKPSHGDIVIAALDGELTCKVLDLHQRRLLSANDHYPPINLKEGVELIIEGVVLSSIRYHRYLKK